MTDFSDYPSSLPNRLGISARIDEHEQLVVAVEPVPETCRHGAVRASVLSFVVDAVAGIVLDDDVDVWTLTTEMSVRTRAVPAPAKVEGRTRILRKGRRSATGEVDLVDGDGNDAGWGVASFTRVERRPGDAHKVILTPEHFDIFGSGAPLDRPLVDAAGIQVLDTERGIVEVEVGEHLRNPAGTLQGAMVALVAEVAAEEHLSTKAATPVVVTELDIRYLAQAREGIVRTRLRPLGPAPTDPVLVELIDVAADRLTTHVVVRGTPIDGAPVSSTER